MKEKLVQKEGFQIKVNPAYCSFNKTRDGEIVNIYHYAGSVKDSCICRLQRQHYLKPAKFGILLVAEIDRNIVGCAILGKLTFGNPIRRAEHIDWNYPRLTAQKRVELINRILWIRRIVVDKRFRKKGIGAIIAKNVVSFSKGFLVPTPVFVEIITSIDYFDSYNRLGFKHDFLLASRYETVGSPWRSTNKIWIKELEGYIDKYVWKRYYICRIT